MEIATNVILLILFTILLIVSADILLTAFTTFASKLEMSPFLVGFVILAVASSLPEISVAINSSVEGVPGLSVGNLLGATIIIMSLIIGLNAIRHGSLPFRGGYSISSLLLTLVLMMGMLIMLFDGKLTKVEGIAIVALYSITTLMIVRKASSRHTPTEKVSIPLYRLFTFGLIGLFGLLISANLLVDKAVNLAGLLNVPNSLVGLLVLSVGTNLPELTLLFRSTGVEKSKLSVGNFLGSATINVPIMGLLAVWGPVTISNPTILLPAIIVLGITILAFGYFAITDREITKREGYILVGLFAIWFLAEIVLTLGS